MPVPRVRADYDALGRQAQTFAQQAEAVQKTLLAIQAQQQALQGGGWVGEGATAFFKEMEAEVVPSLRRLLKALATAGETTRQIEQVMRQAEAEAASYFRDVGTAGGASGLAASSAALGTLAGGASDLAASSVAVAALAAAAAGLVASGATVGALTEAARLAPGGVTQAEATLESLIGISARLLQGDQQESTEQVAETLEQARAAKEAALAQTGAAEQEASEASQGAAEAAAEAVGAAVDSAADAAAAVIDAASDAAAGAADAAGQVIGDLFS